MQLNNSLDKSIALTSADAIKGMTSILRECFSITHFCYIKSFSDNTHLLLCTDPEWTKCFYLNYYDYAPYHKIEKSYQPGYELWDLQNENPVFSTSRNEFNIDHGITFIQKQSDGTEFFNFASVRDNYKINNFFIHNIDLLIRFNLYFKQQARELIRQAHSDRLILPRCIETSDDLFCASSTHKTLPPYKRQYFESATLLKRYYIDEANGVYLTAQEYACVSELVQGNGIKIIAHKLNISQRTAEAHIDNAREKLLCRNKIQLIMKVLNLGLIKVLP